MSSRAAQLTYAKGLVGGSVACRPGGPILPNKDYFPQMKNHWWEQVHAPQAVAQLLAHLALSLLSTRASPTSTAPLSITTRYNNFNLSISQLYILSMTRTGASLLTMESGGTATATAPEEFPAASKLMWSILRSMIFVVLADLRRRLLKPARHDVKATLSAPSSPSWPRIFQMTMVAHCLEVQQILKETRAQIHLSQDLLHVQVKFYLHLTLYHSKRKLPGL